MKNSIFTTFCDQNSILCFSAFGFMKWSQRKATVNSPPQQPDDFLVTVKTLGRLLSYIFPTSVFTIYVLCCILFLSWGFHYEGFDDMSFYLWMHQCFNTYVLILLFYGVLNVWGLFWLLSIVSQHVLKLSIKAIVTVKVTSWARREKAQTFGGNIQ